MNTTDDSNTTVLDPTTDFRHELFFGILTPTFILSVLCYSYIFIQFCQKRRYYRNVHNHFVLIILVVSFLQVFLIQQFLI
jgi:hypothetical protein